MTIEAANEFVKVFFIMGLVEFIVVLIWGHWTIRPRGKK